MRDGAIYLAALVFSAMGLAVLAMVAFVELLIAMPVPVWVYAGVSLLFVGGALIALRASQRRWLAVLPLAGVALAWVLCLVPWTSRKPFLQALEKVAIGMDEAEVRAVMNGYMEGTGWPVLTDVPAEPVGSGAPTLTASVETHGEMEIEGSLVFRHSNDGRFNADWGIVEFDDGRVTGVRFSAD